MNFKSAGIILFLLLLTFGALAQEIKIDASSKPLNKLLLEISNEYDIQLSFNDKLLSEYRVSLSQTFPDPESALSALIQPFPLVLEQSGDVFIIFETPPKKPEKKTFRLSGQVIENGTNELLPYSHVIINGHPTATDLKGSFTYISDNDSMFSVKASQLGYFILDTMLASGSQHNLFLSPSVIGLNEVVISDKAIEKSTQIGDQPGTEKLNHKTAYFLPGFGDNSVNTLLRLQPGILASGEQTSEPTIWGGYNGHSKVLFDGFTIYGLKNFNDNISVFNPLIAKSIDIYKGGYDARFGERVGGIVDITGKNGNMQKPAFDFCMNNTTLNGMIDLPIIKNKSALLISFRQTYYELYNPSEFNLFRKNPSQGTDSVLNLNIVPEYTFRDINVKYSAKIKNNDLFYLSLYASADDFSYAINEPLQNVNLIKNTSEKTSQVGGSLFYGKNWRNGNTSNFSMIFSDMILEFKNLQGVENKNGTYRNIGQDLTSTNKMDEFNINIDNRFAVKQNQMFEFGGGFYANRSVLAEDTFNIEMVNFEEKASRTFLYFQNLISDNRGSTFKVGLRFNYANNIRKAYLEPRVSASFRVADYWKVNVAWGIYNQFLVKSSVVDDVGNYRYIWAISNNDDVPVAHASHYVLGTSYYQNQFTFSFEGFYKITNGISRYIKSQRFNIEDVFRGNSRSYGIDILMQKEYNGHQAWIAYTLSKVEEHFDYQKKDDFRRAPQDQRHEVKLAALANFDPFYFSATYVYGSGFPAGAPAITGVDDNQPYSRLDVSFIYKFLVRKMKGEIGLSILNVLNTQNLKYENFERIPSIQTNNINIYTEAIPFTPALYLKITM